MNTTNHKIDIIQKRTKTGGTRGAKRKKAIEKRSEYLLGIKITG